MCVHGTEMGRAALDLTVFRAWQLHDEFGLNVVMPVLPMHGPRARGLPKGAVFPGEDILDDVHATAQAVWDIRRLLTWIRSQEPQSPIGLNSLSLGATSQDWLPVSKRVSAVRSSVCRWPMWSRWWSATPGSLATIPDVAHSNWPHPSDEWSHRYRLPRWCPCRAVSSTPAWLIGWCIHANR